MCCGLLIQAPDGVCIGLSWPSSLCWVPLTHRLHVLPSMTANELEDSILHSTACYFICSCYRPPLQSVTGYSEDLAKCKIYGKVNYCMAWAAQHNRCTVSSPGGLQRKLVFTVECSTVCKYEFCIGVVRWRRAQGRQRRQQGAHGAGPAGQPTLTLWAPAHLPLAGTLAQASRPNWQTPMLPARSATWTPAAATHRCHHICLQQHPSMQEHLALHKAVCTAGTLLLQDACTL